MPPQLCVTHRAAASLTLFTRANWIQAYVNNVPPRAGETMKNVPFEPRDVVRVASIGIGGRGRGQLNEMLEVGTFFDTCYNFHIHF